MTMRIDYNQVAPGAAAALAGVYGYVMKSGLAPALVELVYLRVSQINNCAYCLDMHTRDLLKQGVAVEKLALLQAWREAGGLFVAALPVFVAGLLEDITKDIGASKRLLAAFASAAIAWWLLGGVSRVGIAPVDWVLSFWPVSLIFTMFAVGGCTHALNIVD
ncbi:carboxymuconolactone decarboxylase family protein, partial [Bordetella bronchiseptica E012]|uniref:carboxymuconolactone decarboxylase family protein n=1 Tax=Bordetella bronchiseptica TaxID=518 RepID=UPI000461747C